MIGMFFVPDHQVWDFEFDYYDLFVIWCLDIVFLVQ